jgi:hypothetical protein
MMPENGTESWLLRVKVHCEQKATKQNGNFVITKPSATLKCLVFLHDKVVFTPTRELRGLHKFFTAEVWRAIVHGSSAIDEQRKITHNWAF